MKSIYDLVIGVNDDSTDGTYAYVSIGERETLIVCPFYCVSSSSGNQHGTTAQVEIRIPTNRKGRINGVVTYPELQSYVSVETQFWGERLDQDTAYYTVTRYPLRQISDQLGLDYRAMKKHVVW